MGRKWLTQEKRSKDELFDALVRNALGFVKSSLDHIERNPKNSIVDLYTAVELFLKARLMAEHWTLMLSKPETGDLQSLSVGDFLSVYLDDALKRIKSILGEKIDVAASDNFKALGEHRNQIVHFAHSGLDDLAAAQAGVIVEQWASWHYLHALISGPWEAIFRPYATELDVLNQRMMRQAHFIKARFDILKLEIGNEMKKGKKVITCAHCKTDAAIVGETHKWGVDYACMVCGVSDTAVTPCEEKQPCPGCGDPLEFFNPNLNKCLSYQFVITANSLIDLCSAHISEGYQWWEEGQPHIAWCHNCDHPQPSVFFIDGMWSCVSCHDRGWGAVTCERCGEFVTGDMDRIQYYACHKCEDQVRQSLRAQAGGAYEQDPSGRGCTLLTGGVRDHRPDQ